MSSIYVFSSQTQSFIFSNQFQEVNNAYLILIGNKKAREDILFYLNKYKWEKVYSFDDISSKNLLIKVLNLVLIKYRFLLILLFNRINDLFIGSINNYIQLIFVSLFNGHGNVNLMTDGMQQIIVNEQRKKGVEYIRKTPRLFNYFGLDRFDIKSLNFITPYNIKSNIDIITQIPLKKIETSCINPSVVGFIGMPLVELGFLSLEQHLNYLQLISEKFIEKEFVYFAHPSESQSNLNEIRKNFKVVTLSQIFEEFIKVGQNVPQNIISYYSSVLLNAHLMFDELSVFYIKLSILKRQDLANNLKYLYDYFDAIENKNFKEIKI